MKKRIPRNLIEEDGLFWIPQAGKLWGTYKTGAEYRGISLSSFPAYVWRHNLKTITYGRRKLVSKDDLDRISGALQDASQSPERIPHRARR